MQLASVHAVSARDAGSRQERPSPSSVAAAPADADVRDLHRVGRGESLRSIARHYGISLGALKSANRINADTVRAGTVLTIPAS